MKPEDNPTLSRSAPDESVEDTNRLLRLDRRALRLEPPVVRFSEDRGAGAPSR